MISAAEDAVVDAETEEREAQGGDMVDVANDDVPLDGGPGLDIVKALGGASEGAACDVVVNLVIHFKTEGG